MSRFLHFGTLVLVCAALAPACLLDAGPVTGSGATGGGGGTGASGGDGGAGGSMEACGNGKLEGAEQCDDGNLVAGEGCDAACVIEPGWACGGEPSKCAETCGDGNLDTGEDCDDKDIDPGDGCDQACKVEQGWECSGQPSTCVRTCGDGEVGQGEDCDDGNPASGDGCSDVCLVEHTCGNGVVEPTEQCDGGPGCTDCKLDAGTVCGDALVIEPDPMGIDRDTGARTSYFEGDSTGDGVIVPKGEVLAAPCHNFENAVLHTYTTGKTPSIVTVESLAELENRDPTFDKTVVWVYRDCPNKKELEACDADVGGAYSILTTGFIPAQTTLFIVLAGDGNNEKGPYRLKITEQPVKLFFHESFGPETAPGTYPLPASVEQTLNQGGDGGWTTCVPTPGNACGTSAVKSHSGGALGFAYAATATKTEATLATLPVDLSKLVVGTAQFDYDLNKNGGSGFVEVTSVAGDLTGTPLKLENAASGRAILEMPVEDGARLQFFYDDGAAAGLINFAVDDIYIYGH